MSILLGNEKGEFNDEIRVLLADRPEPVVTGDFDGDGVLDLATANIISNDVSVLLGRGDGDFAFEIRIPVGASPQAIVAGHFNDDDLLDLAVANRSDDNVSILIQRRNGCETELCFDETVFGVGDAPSSIVAGQFSDDDFLDLAVSNLFSDSVTVLLGKVDGTFQKAKEFDVGSEPTAIVSKQFTDDNGDGRINELDDLDLATSNRKSNDVSVLLGNGNGGFDPPEQFSVGRSPRSIVSDD